MMEASDRLTVDYTMEDAERGYRTRKIGTRMEMNYVPTEILTLYELRRIREAVERIASLLDSKPANT
jgi:hypothetical protein